MTTINKDIKLIATAETGGAESKFATLDRTIENTTKSMGGLSRSTNQGNMMLMSTSRIVQDMPYGLMGVGNNITFLAEQFAMAKAQGVSFEGAIKQMMVSFMGTGGIVFGISLLTTVLTTLSMQSRSTKKDIEDFADIMDRASESAKGLKEELGEVATEMEDALSPGFLQILGSVFTGGNTGELIKDLMQSGDFVAASNRMRELNKEQDRQNELTKIAIGLTKENAKSIKEVTKENMLREKDLKFIQKYLTAEIDKIPVINKQYKEYKDALESVNNVLGKGRKEMEKHLDILDKLKDKYKEGLNSNIDLKHLPFGRTPTNPFQKYFTGMQNVQRPGLGFSDSEIRQQFLKENEFLITNVISSLGVLRGEFSNFWQSVFGEANSLLEKLLMNFGENLLELGTKRLAGGLLDFIVPGLGTAFGALSGRSQTIQNNIIIDNQTVAVMYTTGKNYAQRLRKD